ncbi:Gypsy retrotransposon integrase-like protein 1, partial [Mucuna pruriens]
MVDALKIEEAKANDRPWYHDIREYLKKGIYPLGATENDKRTLKRLAASFFLSGVILYKRSADLTLLCCVDDREAQEIIEEVHEGAFGTHVNGHAIARKILRASYYWSKMELDHCQHVKRCMKCQMFADNIHVPSSTLHNLTSPWPFSMWGLDMIGLIESKASNGHRFILVAIDYFTKWVEAASYTSVTKSAVVKFIKRDIICRYDLPAHIITNNGTNLNNKMMTELCQQFKIKHHNSTPYRPKMNGAIEVANKNIKRIVQKMVVTYKDWHDLLPYALHGYRTSICMSTRETPYLLVYGTEAVLPIEVEILSLRILTEADWLDQLNLIEEKRLTTICHRQLYQRRIKNAFDKKVRPRIFKEGDLVLKKRLPNIKDPRGKWTPNYEGPYMVKRAFTRGDMVLADAEGQELKHPVNSTAVKIKGRAPRPSLGNPTILPLRAKSMKSRFQEKKTRHGKRAKTPLTMARALRKASRAHAKWDERHSMLT